MTAAALERSLRPSATLLFDVHSSMSPVLQAALCKLRLTITSPLYWWENWDLKRLTIWSIIVEGRQSSFLGILWEID